MRSLAVVTHLRRTGEIGVVEFDPAPVEGAVQRITFRLGRSGFDRSAVVMP